MKRFVYYLLIFTIFFNLPNILFSKTEQDTTYQQLKILMDVLNYTKENYVEEVDMEKLINSAAKGVTRALDPFSQFMEPNTFKELKVETEGQFGGLGIRIAIRDEWLTVITPLPGTPAYKAGILPGDKIIKIEGESTQGITIEEAVKKLRGTPGTKVNITIMREGTKEPIDYTIVRDIIKIEVVKYNPQLKNGIGYIALYEFNNNSLDEITKALKNLKEKGMKGLILDLRNNPGGLLNQAVEIAKLFIGENKLIVYTEGRRSPRQEYRANDKAPFSDIPMVTLVNGGSASGAEILAGALQDNKRSIIIGSQTFGKASVQSVINLDKGYGLKLTTAKYYTPSGRMIQRSEKSEVKGSTETYTGGIIPDIIINVPKEIEAKLYQQREEIYVSGKEPVSAVKKEEQVEDVVLNRAYEILTAIMFYQDNIKK
jgi:carboxyl-terminal processing protease